jgi:hypothetical protein
MPNMMQGGVQPPEDSYSGSDTSEDATEKGKETPTKSALLPKSMFDGDPEPGTKITLKVDAVYEDEVECSLASEPTPTEKSRPTIDEDLAASATESE